MEKYTDDDIRKMDKITCKIAADYLGISPNLLTIGMRNDKLPIGFAVRQEDRYRENWTYAIIPERLIAYKHGKINEVQVQGIEHNLETIIKEFTEMKKVCPPRKNRQKTQVKNRMKRMTNMVLSCCIVPHLFHGSLDNEPLKV